MDRETIAQLQGLILRSVVDQSVLPGQQAVLAFPDLAAVTMYGEVLVAVENLADPEHPPAGVRAVDPLRLAETVEEHGQAAYLRFGEPEPEHETGIRFNLRVLMGFPDVEPLPLGELVVTFENHDGWVTVYPTHALAF